MDAAKKKSREQNNSVISLTQKHSSRLCLRFNPRTYKLTDTPWYKGGSGEG